MPERTRIDNMSSQAIAELLSTPSFLLSEEEAIAVDDFVDRIGGIDNAWLAVDMLSRVEW
jgi:hypothetical protein